MRAERSVVRALREIEELLEWEPEELDRVADTSSVVDAREKSRSSGWSVLGRRIVSAYRETEFLGAIIYGKLGAGKSTYSFKVALDAMRSLGFRVDFSDIVFRYSFFDIGDLIPKLRGASWRKRIPLLVWDDAGVFGGAYMFFTSVAKAKAISDVVKLVRSRASALIMSTPSPEDMLRPIRRYENIIVRVVKVDERWSRAHGYGFSVAPSGSVRVYKQFEEEFVRRIPDDVYPKYMDMRDQYIDHALTELEDAIREEELKRASKLMAAARKVLEDEESPPELRRLARSILARLGAGDSGGEEDVEVELVG